MKIESPAFKSGQPIPQKYTCDGEDKSPALQIHNLPAGAKSLAIIVDDPDAPRGVFDHWIAWNLPPATSIAEGAKIPNQGKNGFGDSRYRGPCPPKGKPHRYFFKIYALDSMIDLPNGSSKSELEEAIENHILEEAELIGLYQR